MTFKKLKRTNFNHSGPHTAQDHYQDYTEYQAPLAEMQHANFFDWGIVQGLNVTGSIGGTALQVEAGVAVDREGKLISLATSGLGDVGDNPDGGQNDPKPVPIPLSTSGLENETLYVTIRFYEFYSKSSTDPYDPGDYEQRPWIRLQKSSDYNPASNALILATLTTGSSALITSIHGQDRRMLTTSLGKLVLRKGARSDSSGVFDISEETTIELDGNAATVMIGADGNAGDLSVKDGSGKDILHAFETHGAGTRVDIGDSSSSSGALFVKDGSGRDTFSVYGSSANVTIGANGKEGDLRVIDGAGRLVLDFNGDTAALFLGTSGNAGDLVVRDSGGSESAKIEGNTGKFLIKRIDPYGDTLDIDARFLRIHGWDLSLDGRSGGNKRALVDNNNRLVINWNTDYTNGVDINKLHLAAHIRRGYWENWYTRKWGEPDGSWRTFYEHNTRLKNSEWYYITMCEIGMYDGGTVSHFWWGVDNESYTNSSDEIVIRWKVQYSDTGDDWWPWSQHVFWLAYRK